MATDRRRGIGGGTTRGVPMGTGVRDVVAVAPPGSHGVLPRQTDGLVRHTAMSHEVRRELIQCAGCSSSEVCVWDVPWILGPVPVVQRELWVDLPEHLFKPIHNFAMPRKEFRSMVHMGCLVNL